MSDPSSGRGRSAAKKHSKKKNAKRKDALASEGVLANLPRTRPQRSSARREAARHTSSASASAKVEPTGAPAPKPHRTASAKAQPASAAGRKPRLTAASKAQRAPAPAPAAKQTVAKKHPAKAKVTAKRVQDPAPRQGFETERDPVTGSVQPPGGLDLLSSAAELAGELTKSGLSSGGRLLKDVFARLPLN
jgi:hypothetical protein